MKVLIIRNDCNNKAIDASFLLATYLASEHIDYEIFDSSKLAISTQDVQVGANTKFGKDVCLAVALGGDGTILRAAHLVKDTNIALLGLNFGHLGFLANECEDGVVAACALALSGEAREDVRANLRIDIVCEGERDPFDDEASDVFAGSTTNGAVGDAVGDALDGAAGDAADVAENTSFARPSLFALNEVAITRGTFGRMIDFDLGISGAHIANLRGDGLVVSTATGSSAYALSAGGPLVAPSFSGLVVVPIAPHSLRTRAIVTAENDVVEMGLSESIANSESVVFLDGEPLSFDAPPRRVYVRRGSVPTRLLRLQSNNFYEHAAKVFF